MNVVFGVIRKRIQVSSVEHPYRLFPRDGTDLAITLKKGLPKLFLADSALRRTGGVTTDNLGDPVPGTIHPMTPVHKFRGGQDCCHLGMIQGTDCVHDIRHELCFIEILVRNRFREFAPCLLIRRLVGRDLFEGPVWLKELVFAF